MESQEIHLPKKKEKKYEVLSDSFLAPQTIIKNKGYKIKITLGYKSITITLH